MGLRPSGLVLFDPRAVAPSLGCCDAGLMTAAHRDDRAGSRSDPAWSMASSSFACAGGVGGKGQTCGEQDAAAVRR